jgi:hypothetical protein
MRSVSYLRMVPSRNTSARGGSGCLPPTTVKQCGNDSTPGRNSRAFRPSHKGYDSGSQVSSYRLIRSIGNKLTTPPAAVNWRQGERKPNSLLYNHIRHYHLIQAKPDVIKQESCNLSTFSPNVSRTTSLFSHNPSRNWQCNQVELPMKSIRYS